MIAVRRPSLRSAALFWAAAAVLLGLCGRAACFDFELTVEQGQTVCFQDYVSGNNSITFGFSAFNVSSLEEMLENVYTGYAQTDSPQPQASSGSQRRVLAQKKPKQPAGAAGQKPKTPRSQEPASDFEQGLEEEQLPEDYEPENGVKFEESAVIKSAKKKPRSGEAADRPLGRMWVKNQNNEILSPAAMKNFRIYKHRFDSEFSVIDICYEGLAAQRHYVRLVYTVHSLRPQETVVPSKGDSDALLEKIMKVEDTFARFLSHFEQLERFQREFVSYSDGALKNFMIFAQGLLGCYLLLGWLMKLAAEKTLKAKKLV